MLGYVLAIRIASSKAKPPAIIVEDDIAEGYAKKESQAEFKRYLLMALGSSDEMQVLLSFVKDLGYINTETYEKSREIYKIHSSKSNH